MRVRSADSDASLCVPVFFSGGTLVFKWKCYATVFRVLQSILAAYELHRTLDELHIHKNNNQTDWGGRAIG